MDIQELQLIFAGHADAQVNRLLVYGLRPFPPSSLSPHALHAIIAHCVHPSFCGAECVHLRVHRVAAQGAAQMTPLISLLPICILRYTAIELQAILHDTLACSMTHAPCAVPPRVQGCIGAVELDLVIRSQLIDYAQRRMSTHCFHLPSPSSPSPPPCACSIFRSCVLRACGCCRFACQRVLMTRSPFGSSSDHGRSKADPNRRASLPHLHQRRLQQRLSPGSMCDKIRIWR